MERNKFYSIKTYMLLKKNVINLIKALKDGPVIIAMHVSNDLKFYKTGVFDGAGCDDNEVNHAALCVGYDLDVEVPYFLMKNAWGKEWG